MKRRYLPIVAAVITSLAPGIAWSAESNEPSTITMNNEIIFKTGLDFEQLPDRVEYADKSSEALFGELRLKVNATLGTHWRGHADMRGFAATSAVSQRFDDDNGSGRTVETSDANSFAHLRRVWLRYDGITDYPGEHLTAGLQKVDSRSGLLWDGDIESLTWRFSSTRIQFQAGLGERFDTYRTNTDLSRLDKDKPRLFTELSYDWTAYHELTLSAMYAEQTSDDIPESIQSGAPDGINGEWLWYGASLSSNWTNRRSRSPFAYTLQWLGLTGTSDFLGQNGQSYNAHDISAWAVDAGVRYDFETVPASLGFGFAQGSGGFDESESNMYVQTGLQSNRDTYTGNNLYMYRFNEALRPDLTNLRSYAAFGSCTPVENLQLAGAVSKIERRDDELPIYRLSQPLDLENGSKDIGWGIDFSIRHEINRKLLHVPISYYRLRNSAFFPGNSFTEDGDTTAYAVLFEIVGRIEL